MSNPFWVFVSGTYRTASTTQYCIARDIVEETKSGIGIGYHTEKRLEERDRDTRKGYIVVCKVFKFLPETSRWGKQFLEEGRLKAVCTVRDPRDIIVSMKSRGGARKVDGTKVASFDFRQTATESFPVWLGQLEQWADLGPKITMVTRYEDFVVNLYKEARRIARHLGISGSEAIVSRMDKETVTEIKRRIVETKRKINEMRGGEGDVEDPTPTEIFDDLLKTIAKRYTVQTLVAAKKAFLQKKRDGEDIKEDPALPSIPAIKFGTSGQWRTWLSTGEVALVTKTCGKFMERFGYPI